MTFRCQRPAVLPPRLRPVGQRRKLYLAASSQHGGDQAESLFTGQQQQVQTRLRLQRFRELAEKLPPVRPARPGSGEEVFNLVDRSEDGCPPAARPRP